MTYAYWNIQAITGYEPKTTFYEDFSIAENFGPNAIRETYDWAFREWKDDPVYLTELVMVLNWKLWEQYQVGNQEFADLYNELWEKADIWACEHLEGEDLAYFYRTTD